VVQHWTVDINAAGRLADARAGAIGDGALSAPSLACLVGAPMLDYKCPTAEQGSHRDGIRTVVCQHGRRH
jgi:hypothetical protein